MLSGVVRGCVLAAVLILLLLTPLPSLCYTVTYTYRVSYEGSASVTAVVSGVEGLNTVYVRVDEGFVRGSAVAFSSSGDLLPVEVLNESWVTIYVGNTSGDVVLTYTATVGTRSGPLTKVVVAPEGRAVVVLPEGAALLYFNGTAEVSFSGSSIVLTYEEAGTYLVEFVTQTPREGLSTPPPTPYIAAALTAAGVATYVLLKLRLARKQPQVGLLRGELDERDLRVLKALRGRALTISGLARDLGVSKSVAWRRVRKLVALGLVRRSDVEGRTYVTLTKRGEEALKEGE